MAQQPTPREAYPELQKLAAALSLLSDALIAGGFLNVFPEGQSLR
jgi:hypothetical protein